MDTKDTGAVSAGLYLRRGAQVIGRIEGLLLDLRLRDGGALAGGAAHDAPDKMPGNVVRFLQQGQRLAARGLGCRQEHVQ